jgi:hypothetical protein
MRVVFEDPLRLIRIPEMEVDHEPSAAEIATHVYPHMKRTRLAPHWHVETDVFNTRGIVRMKDRDITFEVVK